MFVEQMKRLDKDHVLKTAGCLQNLFSFSFPCFHPRLAGIPSPFEELAFIELLVCAAADGPLHLKLTL